MKTTRIIDQDDKGTILRIVEHDRQGSTTIFDSAYGHRLTLIINGKDVGPVSKFSMKCKPDMVTVFRIDLEPKESMLKRIIRFLRGLVR